MTRDSLPPLTNLAMFDSADARPLVPAPTMPATPTIETVNLRAVKVETSAVRSDSACVPVGG
jgi:hypothetical protein